MPSSEKPVVIRRSSWRRGAGRNEPAPADGSEATSPIEGEAADRTKPAGLPSVSPPAVPPSPPDVEKPYRRPRSVERFAAAAAQVAAPRRSEEVPPGRHTPHGGHVDILAPEAETFRGRHVGDRSVRLRRQRIEGVRRIDEGIYEIVATPEPRGKLSRFLVRTWRALIGAPIRSEHEPHERLSKFKALAVFGSDNISSSAYATEEIMRVLIFAGTAALAWTMPLAVAVTLLLAIVVTSYQQTIRAYPKGGGSYIVSSDNLGVIPGLVAGSAIQVGYILTVAVSVSAGVSALTSAFPALYEQRVVIAVFAVAVMAWGNLRGIRESGTLFAAPAYLYLAAMCSLLVYGMFRFLSGEPPPEVPPPLSDASLAHGEQAHVGAQALTIFLILRAFTSGAVGLTGTEAIADGVSAFKPPESRNARITLITMATCFATIFLGISFLSSWMHIVPDANEVETVNSQLTRALVGTGVFYYVVQFSTALLLVLAANTAFADFPRLASFLARDKFLPSHFAFRGDRLAFNNGIIILAIVAAALIVFFRGSVTALIPLYAVGVFVGFTLSQAALARRWWRLREPGWQWRMAINGTGATITTLVAIIAAITRFTQGAWVVMILIPGLVVLLLTIRRHFQDVGAQLAVDVADLEVHRNGPLRTFHHYVLIPIADLNRATLRAIDYARTLTGQTGDASPAPPVPAGSTGRSRGELPGRHVVIQALHVTDDADAAAALQEKWQRLDPGVELVIVEAPYRALIGPLLRYVDAVERRHPEGTSVVTVLLPEFIPAHWWEHLLHTHTALQIKGALLFRPRTVVTSVPYHLHE